MSYLNCPSCGLTVATSARNLTLEHCPRCRTLEGKLVGLFLSAERGGSRPLAGAKKREPDLSGRP